MEVVVVVVIGGGGGGGEQVQRSRVLEVLTVRDEAVI